ncbi:MAG: hypothetical protein K2W95_26030 [Candidatus Obscuribacterales bacterium]|nr:hypothetical protein [Candidatus Obscuribacterales bacterium]
MKLAPFWNLAKFGKLFASLVLAAYPAFVLAMVALTQYFLSQADPGCNCYGEKMGIARIAFESNWQVGYYVTGLFDLIIAAVLFFTPWTRGRLVAVVLSIAAGFAAWEFYSSYYTMLPSDNERWYVYPLRSVSAGPYVELLREYVDPILIWRSGCAMAGAGATYLLAEVGFLAARLMKKLPSARESSVSVDTAAQT